MAPYQKWTAGVTFVAVKFPLLLSVVTKDVRIQRCVLRQEATIRSHTGYSCWNCLVFLMFWCSPLDSWVCVLHCLSALPPLQYVSKTIPCFVSSIAAQL